METPPCIHYTNTFPICTFVGDIALPCLISRMHPNLWYFQEKNNDNPLELAMAITHARRRALKRAKVRRNLRELDPRVRHCP